MPLRVYFISNYLTANTAFNTWRTTFINVELLQFFSLRLKKILYLFFYVKVYTLFWKDLLQNRGPLLVDYAAIS